MNPTPTIPIQPVVYPESDGQPMAENMTQYRWIVTLRENIHHVLKDREALIAADNLIYPVEGHPEICVAPDVYIALGRPHFDRGCYKVWEEDQLFPQVIFEVLSPGNRAAEMARKFDFYQRYGAQEYYVYDPDTSTLQGWVRQGDRLVPIPQLQGWVSPLLGIRFDLSGEELQIFKPDGSPFLTTDELFDRVQTQQQRLEHERRQRQVEEDRARQAEDRAERLAAKLRELGLDPDAN